MKLNRIAQLLSLDPLAKEFKKKIVVNNSYMKTNIDTILMKLLPDLPTPFQAFTIDVIKNDTPLNASPSSILIYEMEDGVNFGVYMNPVNKSTKITRFNRVRLENDNNSTKTKTTTKTTTIIRSVILDLFIICCSIKLENTLLLERQQRDFFDDVIFNITKTPDYLNNLLKPILLHGITDDLLQLLFPELIEGGGDMKFYKHIASLPPFVPPHQSQYIVQLRNSNTEMIMKYQRESDKAASVVDTINSYQFRDEINGIIKDIEKIASPATLDKLNIGQIYTQNIERIKDMDKSLISSIKLFIDNEETYNVIIHPDDVDKEVFMTPFRRESS